MDKLELDILTDERNRKVKEVRKYRGKVIQLEREISEIDKKIKKSKVEE